VDVSAIAQGRLPSLSIDAPADAADAAGPEQPQSAPGGRFVPDEDTDEQ
jgi:hypothetical protein